MEKLINRAEAVIEAMPYLRKLRDKIIVIKYGGNAMTDNSLKAKVMEDLVLLNIFGIHPVLVHGGGPDITAELKKNKIEVKFIEGLRYTDEETMKVVEKVLGKLNGQIVSMLNKVGRIAKGLSGKKGKLIKAQKRIIIRDGQKVDLGYVGDIKSIDAKLLSQILASGRIPVISSIGVDKNGNTYNVNADTAASEIAAVLKASKLILLTNIRGVYDNKEQFISLINAQKTRRMIKKGVITGGMIPKVRCGLFALKNGVEKVHIIDGRIPHAILLELFTDIGIGTMVER